MPTRCSRSDRARTPVMTTSSLWSAGRLSSGLRLATSLARSGSAEVAVFPHRGGDHEADPADRQQPPDPRIVDDEGRDSLARRRRLARRGWCRRGGQHRAPGAPRRGARGTRVRSARGPRRGQSPADGAGAPDDLVDARVWIGVLRRGPRGLRSGCDSLEGSISEPPTEEAPGGRARRGRSPAQG